MNPRRRPLLVALATVTAALGWAGAAPAELPPGHEVDQKEVCLSCHDMEAAAVAHAPVADGECSACHNPHVARFAGLLNEQPAFLCVSCHEEIAPTLRRTVVHRPAAEGRCQDCHAAHGGAHQGLLIKPGRDLCRSCHQPVAEWEGRPVQHSPFARSRCADCHDPHGADEAGLASAAGGELCVRCHPASTAFRQRHGGYPVGQADCHQCHDPHASESAGLFRSHMHAPFEAGDCTTCHQEADAQEPFALTAAQASLCGDCHEEQVEASRDAVFPHVSAGGGACTACHNPHSGDGAALLNTDARSLCLGCHDPGGASSGADGRYVTHADNDCSTCHAPHGGSHPRLLTMDSVELCGSCHDHEHGINHPLGLETRDPRSGDPMSCLSCHSMHDAPEEMYLHASQERELCIGCHKDIGP